MLTCFATSYDKLCMIAPIFALAPSCLYTLPPCKVSWHKIAPTPLSILVQLNIWCSLELSIKICILKHVLDDGVRVSEPHLILSLLPVRGIFGVIKAWCLEALPRGVPMGCGVNRIIDFLVAGELTIETTMGGTKAPSVIWYLSWYFKYGSRSNLLMT